MQFQKSGSGSTKEPTARLSKSSGLEAFRETGITAIASYSHGAAPAGFKEAIWRRLEASDRYLATRSQEGYSPHTIRACRLQHQILIPDIEDIERATASTVAQKQI